MGRINSQSAITKGVAEGPDFGYDLISAHYILFSGSFVKQIDSKLF
jgi:hypothetical protein